MKPRATGKAKANLLASADLPLFFEPIKLTKID
jgi:hypothetical protein